MKKILFIIPPSFNIEEINSDVSDKMPVFTIPYGVLSIIAYAKKYSRTRVEGKILDLNLEIYKFSKKYNNTDFMDKLRILIKQAIQSFQPDVIGISALFNICYSYLEIISSEVAELEYRLPLVIGGGVATNLYAEVLAQFPRIDAACYAEGEIPVCYLLDAENSYTYLEESPAWITRKSLQEKRDPKPLYVDNLDDIPFFDYSIIDINQYQGRSFSTMYREQMNREMSIHTSRGCPFNCVFCANGSVHGKKIRYMSVEKVLDEVKGMLKLSQINVLLIEDDHFLSNKNRAKIILENLSELNIRLEFPNGLAVYAIDDEIAALLKKAGTVTATLAVESGSNYVLQHVINKPLRIEMVEKAVNSLRMQNINVHGFFVLGLPGETENHRNETLILMKKVGFDWVYPFIAIPIAGSRLYNECREKGYLINNDFSRCIMTKGNIKAPSIDPDKLEEEVYLMNLDVNFVNNFNYSQGYYYKTIEYLKPIAQRYPSHAFAHYYLSKAYIMSGEYTNKSEEHLNRFYKIINESDIWSKYAKHFKLV